MHNIWRDERTAFAQRRTTWTTRSPRWQFSQTRRRHRSTRCTPPSRLLRQSSCGRDSRCQRKGRVLPRFGVRSRAIQLASASFGVVIGMAIINNLDHHQSQPSPAPAPTLAPATVFPRSIDSCDFWMCQCVKKLSAVPREACSSRCAKGMCRHQISPDWGVDSD